MTVNVVDKMRAVTKLADAISDCEHAMFAEEIRWDGIGFAARVNALAIQSALFMKMFDEKEPHVLALIECAKEVAERAAEQLAKAPATMELRGHLRREEAA